MRRAILILIIVIATAIGLSIAEGFLFDYYEQSRANEWSYIASIPILLYLFISFLTQQWKYSLKEGKERVIQAIKHAVSGVATLGILHYFILTPILSGSLLIINSHLGTQKTERITGVVKRAWEYGLRIQTKEGYLIVETNGVAIKKYGVGSTFDELMQVGSLGLLTQTRATKPQAD